MESHVDEPLDCKEPLATAAGEEAREQPGAGIWLGDYLGGGGGKGGGEGGWGGVKRKE